MAYLILLWNTTFLSLLTGLVNNPFEVSKKCFWNRKVPILLFPQSMKYRFTFPTAMVLWAICYGIELCILSCLFFEKINFQWKMFAAGWERAPSLALKGTDLTDSEDGFNFTLLILDTDLEHRTDSYLNDDGLNLDLDTAHWSNGNVRNEFLTLIFLVECRYNLDVVSNIPNWQNLLKSWIAIYIRGKFKQVTFHEISLLHSQFVI